MQCWTHPARACPALENWLYLESFATSGRFARWFARIVQYCSSIGPVHESFWSCGNARLARCMDARLELGPRHGSTRLAQPITGVCLARRYHRLHLPCPPTEQQLGVVHLHPWRRLSGIVAAIRARSRCRYGPRWEGREPMGEGAMEDSTPSCGFGRLLRLHDPSKAVGWRGMPWP